MSSVNLKNKFDKNDDDTDSTSTKDSFIFKLKNPKIINTFKSFKSSFKSNIKVNKTINEVKLDEYG